MANEANIIKIKRSGTSGAPASLKLGELAYSYLTASGNPTSNGGDRLFIGANGVNGGTGNANDVIVIGGKYFTDLLDHERGVLTASSALIVDSNKKLDELLVDDLSLNGNTLSTTSGDLNVILSANGTGKVQINTSSNSFTLPGTRASTNGYVLTANTDGTTSWAASASSLSLKAGTHTGDTGTDSTVNLLTDDIEFRGDAGAITTALSNVGTHYVVETKARFATTSLAGVATFNSNTFSVGVIGDVNVKAGGISNTQLANKDTYLGSTKLTLGDASGTTNTLAGLVSVTFDGSTSGTSLLQAQAAAGYTTFTLPTTTGTLIGSGDSATVTNTMLAHSTISGISLGDNLANLSVGDNLNLSSAGTTYNGGTAQTINLDSALTGITSISAASGNSVTLNNGTDNLVFDATGQLVLPKFTIPNTSGTAGQVLSWVGNGASSVLAWTTVSTSLTISDGTNTDSIALLTDTFVIAGSGAIHTAVTNNQVSISVDTATSSAKGVATFNTSGFVVTSGDVALKGNVAQSVSSDSGSATPSTNAFTIAGTSAQGISTSATGSTVTVTAADATTSSKGVASFASATFSVSSGAVSVKTGGISNTQLANSKVTVGTTDISLGSSSTTIAGLTQVDIGNLKISGSTIEATNTNGDITLKPLGTGHISASTKLIKDLADPVEPQDAATKSYVDNKVTGLTWKDAANVLSKTDVPLTGSTPLVVDSHTLSNGYRVLLIGQTTTADNGIYDLTISGGSYTLTRSSDADTYDELIGCAIFVIEGTLYKNTGWVQSRHYLSSFNNQQWTQFSGAGAYTAGDGLGQDGTTFSVNVANGIEISSDNVQLASSVAGNGLTYTNGVLDVVGTSDRITVSSNAIDIASTYVGQASITTLGTIGTGVWQGSTVGSGYGGTGFATYAKGDILYASAANTLSKLTAGTNGQTLQLQDGLPVWADLDGGTY